MRDLIAATGLLILLKLASHLSIFRRWNLPDDVKNNGHLFYATSSFVHHSQTIGELKLELQSRNAKLGSKLARFLSCMTSKFDGWPWHVIGHLSYATLKLCTSFCSQWSIQTGVTVQKHLIRVKIRKFLSRLTLIFDRKRPWKRTEHLFYTTSSFVHHFIAICEFKLVLQSKNAQTGSKLVMFCPVWPWNMTDDLEKP